MRMLGKTKRMSDHWHGHDVRHCHHGQRGGPGETCFISQQNLNASNTPDLLTYANSSFKQLIFFETGLLPFYCFESAHLERAAPDG